MDVEQEDSLAIDFGTSNTAVAYYSGKGKRVVEIPYQGPIGPELKKTLPSVVAYDRDGNPLYVGDAALSYGRAFPHLCVDRIKRVMGDSYEEATKDPLLNNIGYKIVEGEEIKGGEGHQALVEVGERVKKRYRPQEVASLIFKEAREAAETHLQLLQQEGKLGDLQLRKVMVTIPAHFNVNQRDAIRDAAELAGFDKDMIDMSLNEPEAAAFEAVVQGKITKDRETILVVNVGSGTTDFATVEVRKTPELMIDVLAVGGETKLGGTNMDIAIVDWAIEHLRRKEGIDPAALDKIDRGDLRAEAEAAKIALSEGRVAAADIKVRELATYVHLSKDDLENIVKPVVENCRQEIVNGLSERGVKKDDFDRILLTGGPMAMPLVRRMVVEEFGDRIIEGVDPMLCVARGAAVAPTAKYVTRPSRAIYLSISVPRQPIKLELVAGTDTALPAFKYPEWEVSPGDSRITVGVLQNTKTTSKDNTYMSMGEYTYTFEPARYKEKFWIVCIVGKEEDRIKVAIVRSEEERDRYVENPDSYKPPFQPVFTKIGAKKTIEREPDIIPREEVERILGAIARNAPLVAQVVFESHELVEPVSRLREAGFEPPPDLEPLITSAEHLTMMLHAQVSSKVYAFWQRKLSDSELDREGAKIGQEIIATEGFKQLRRLIQSHEWQELIKGWVIPEAEISRLVEEIASRKVEVKRKLDRVGGKLAQDGRREIERVLNDLDSTQSYCQGKREIKVWSEGGRRFSEGRTQLEELRNLDDIHLRPLLEE